MTDNMENVSKPKQPSRIHCRTAAFALASLCLSGFGCDESGSTDPCMPYCQREDRCFPGFIEAQYGSLENCADQCRQFLDNLSEAYGPQCSEAMAGYNRCCATRSCDRPCDDDCYYWLEREDQYCQ